ncbi:MAG: sulfite exporter TauE/SafE family protein, partial [Nannocystaceae bacterium]|nr:sulfite exporter TauE/SafE family protein [Nannocystaceae bacterium]
MSPTDLLILLLVALLSFGLAYLGASVGLVLGQLRLPVLVYWLGSPVVGAGTSLAISTIAALVGAVHHARAGRVSIRLVLSIGAPSAIAAFVAARFAAALDPGLVKAAIGIALLVTSAFMLRELSTGSGEDTDESDTDPLAHGEP